jgi:hypothetical protein
MFLEFFKKKCFWALVAQAGVVFKTIEERWLWGREHVVKQPQAGPSTQLGLDGSMLCSSPPCFCCDNLFFLLISPLMLGTVHNNGVIIIILFF